MTDGTAAEPLSAEEAKLDAIRESIERAEKAVDDLCHGAHWTMRVPAEPDRDHDLVISKALRNARLLLAHARLDAGLRLIEGSDPASPEPEEET